MPDKPKAERTQFEFAGMKVESQTFSAWGETGLYTVGYSEFPKTSPGRGCRKATWHFQRPCAGRL